MSTKPVVAVAGASGNLGSHITEAFLSEPFRSKFKNVVLLTRKHSPQMGEWASQGGSVVVYDDANLPESLAGIDVLVNAYVPLRFSASIRQ